MSYCEECARLLRLYADEQAAHKLTAETLTKAIRDGDKAEQYRVERDRLKRENVELRARLAAQSWAGTVDRQGGGFDQSDSREMGG